MGKRGASFEYEILLARGPRDLQYEFVARIGKPRSLPSPVLFSHPIYSTWAEYKQGVDQEKVLAYARDVANNAFPVGTLELDDKWEVHYGDFEFDRRKFPDPASMVKALHTAGFTATLWVYPFVNVDSSNFDLLAKQGLLVEDAEGKPLGVKWWDGEAGLIDYTNPKAREWFKRKLLDLKALGFDGFKFDAGDAAFFGEEARTYRKVHPSEYTDVYMGFVAENFGDFAETRVSTFAQRLGLLTRLGDKDSRWGLDNGLRSVASSTLTYSLIGYPFVMPDMVGGNEYRDERCDAELFVRWVEASAPMPSLQFSILPWRYDEETLAISREYAWLHVAISPYALELARESSEKGLPMVRPLFLELDGEGLFDIYDEFMLGESLLFAPVLDRGKTERDVVLPRAKWIDLWDGETYEGPAELKGYNAPRQKLPTFMRADKPLPEAVLAAVKGRFQKLKPL